MRMLCGSLARSVRREEVSSDPSPLGAWLSLSYLSVSPSCIKHLRLLKQFLISLAAVRKGLAPPPFKPEAVSLSLAPGLSLDTESGGQQRLLRQQQVGTMNFDWWSERDL